MSTPPEGPEPSDPSSPPPLPPPAEPVSRADARANLVLAIALKGSGCVLVLLGLLALVLFGAPGRGEPARDAPQD